MWVVGVGVVALVVGYYAGSTIGFSTGKEAADTQLSHIVSMVFPKPPQEIHSVAATIRAVSGATLTIEMNDPEDYLPHADGTAQKTVAKYASLTGSTTITLIDPSKIDEKGMVSTTTLQPSDLKVGDNVMLQSNQNIRTESSFDVTQVQVTR